MPQVDYRAKLAPKNLANRRDNEVLGAYEPNNILYPLWETEGLIFPYTPKIQTGYVAAYEPTNYVHSIYGYNAYTKSYPKEINLTADFTAQSYQEATYLLAVLHFFKAITKSYFGINPYPKAGTPPPTLLFSYLGEYQFNKTPVIVKEVDYTFESNIDYVPVNTAGKMGPVNLPINSFNGYTYVPTQMTVSVQLDTQYIPIQLRNEFNLDQFRSGNYLDKNKGFI